MSSLPSFQLLKEVSETTHQVLAILEQEFAKAPAGDLRKSPAPDKWNALQCFEHLNRYGEFYLPEFEKTISEAKAKGKVAKTNFSPGWLGDYAFRSMIIDPETKQPRTKMPAFKKYTPSADSVTETAVTEMIRQQKKLIELLKEAESVSLDLRIPTTLSPFIKLKLGDVFRFLVAHNVRHLVQAQRALRGA